MLVLKVFDRFAFLANLHHSLNAYLKMDIGPQLGYALIRLLCLDPIGGDRHVGDEEQSSTSDLIVVTDDEDSCCLHVNGDTGHSSESFEEILIVLP